MKKIIIGSDHAGFNLKNKLVKWLEEKGYTFKDVGTHSLGSVDYPDFAKAVAKEVSNKNFDKGILICGSGIGVAISANKVKGIRAANCHDVVSARLSREHNNTNIITLGERFVAPEYAEEILSVWLATEFLAGRHQKRIDKITEMENL